MLLPPSVNVRCAAWLTRPAAALAPLLCGQPLCRSFRASLVSLLESGAIDVCFCNEDEALELVGGSAAERGADGTAEAGLQYLSQHVNRLAVVTLGEKASGGVGEGGMRRRSSGGSGGSRFWALPAGADIHCAELRVVAPAQSLVPAPCRGA